MTALKSDTPDALKPYEFHGLDLQHRPGSREAVVQCPFCDKAKLHINADTGQYDCKVCGEKGNVYGFIRALWTMSDKATVADAVDEIMVSRGLLLPETVMEWMVARSFVTGEWLVPGHGPDGKLNNLYKYSDMGDGAFRLLSTPGLSHQVHGVPLYDKTAGTVYVCEGPWDAMALWETMRSAKRDEMDPRKLAFTGSPGISLLSEGRVLAVPGANVFRAEWGPLFAGKKVVLLYDNDHPRPHPKIEGQTIPPAGLEGMKRAALTLASSADNAPSSIHYLAWGDGDDGIDHELPDGTDVRDVLTSADDMPGRVKLLEGLLDRVRPIPAGWLQGRSAATAKKGGTEIQPMPCSEWNRLQNSWRKSMKWTEGLDRALSVMLASVASTMSAGDQLWAKIIGPASCGKSTLCEAISTNRKYIKAVSCMRGFHSGFKADKGSADEDNSLIAQLRDKTLITKDGDTLLQSPNLGQILAEARDIYDRTSRTHYRNGMGKDHENINMTWLLCGTASLRRLDKSELGERFVDCVVMEGVDDQQEDDILDRVFAKADRSAGIMLNGTTESQDSPEATETKRLTAGYVNHLRENGVGLADQVGWSSDAKHLVKSYAKFASFIRARPSADQHEVAERELGARLLSQFVRLGKYLAVVLNKSSVDDDVLGRVRRVCLDTSRGNTLQIINSLALAGDAGIDPKAVMIHTGLPSEMTYKLLRFLAGIGAAETFVTSLAAGLHSKPRWRLTDRMRRLHLDTIGAK